MLVPVAIYRGAGIPSFGQLDLVENLSCLMLTRLRNMLLVIRFAPQPVNGVFLYFMAQRFFYQITVFSAAKPPRKIRFLFCITNPMRRFMIERLIYFSIAKSSAVYTLHSFSNRNEK